MKRQMEEKGSFVPSTALGETRVSWVNKVSSLLRDFLHCHASGLGEGKKTWHHWHKVLPVSQGPLPAIRMWGGWVSE